MNSFIIYEKKKYQIIEHHQATQTIQIINNGSTTRLQTQ